LCRLLMVFHLISRQKFFVAVVVDATPPGNVEGRGAGRAGGKWLTATDLFAIFAHLAKHKSE